MLLNEQALKDYGVVEYNTIPEGHHKIERGFIYWDDFIRKTGGKGITAERVRFVTDSTFPMLDISYCHLMYKGQRYDVTGVPFGQIPKRGWKYHLVKILKDEGVFISKLFDNVSVMFG